MRAPWAITQDSLMGERGAIVLTLKVARGQEPLTGTVSAPDGATYAFSGWSELFALLATLVGSS